MPRVTPETRECFMENCRALVFCGGMCRAHYMRWWRHGNPEINNKRGPKVSTRPLFDLIEEQVEIDPNSGCWLWPNSVAGLGYGVISRRKVQYYVHRVTWEHFNGSVPEGMYICHHCDTPPCTNPAHLFLGTPMENTHDMMRKGRWRRGDLYVAWVS